MHQLPTALLEVVCKCASLLCVVSRASWSTRDDDERCERRLGGASTQPHADFNMDSTSETSQLPTDDKPAQVPHTHTCTHTCQSLRLPTCVLFCAEPRI